MREDFCGTEVRVKVVGEGSPTIVFVHGWGGTGHDWDEQVQILSRNYRTVTLDLPGHGESELPKEATMAHLADTVAALVRRHGQGRAVLVGHSVGCRVIARAYAGCAVHVVGLVFVDGSVFAERDPDPAIQVFRNTIAALGMGKFVEAGFASMFVPSSNPALRQRILTQAQGLNESFGAEIWIDTLRWEGKEYAQTLAGIKTPVLMVQSTTVSEDGLGRRSLEPGMTTPWTEFVRDRVPGAQLLIIPSVGHFPHCEAPAAVGQGIRGFVANLPLNLASRGGTAQ
jgi:pimeloyl-ACP methyl ester carboxylesterase